ncbi:DUF1385 domain-containing protein [uncultured Parolsenella sp.]|uniref:DUF1385 domain-containing protein n=1 Tax=uncultured Parolsenella sp. TaxID=2083008 RepID=UPI0025DC5534|nr:DUF1385 domain-containing protein [uncultured Parolsenella sp.]
MAKDEKIAEEGELFRTHIGGSALTEGVMMRGKLSWAVAVREPSGHIYVEEHELPDPAARPAWRRWPLVRGCVSFVESMALSLKAMNLAADHAYDAEGETFASLLAAGRVPDAADPAAASGAADGEPVLDSASAAGSESADPAAEPDASIAESSTPDAISPLLMGGSAVLGVLLGVALFMVVPVFVANLLVGDYTPDNAIRWNLIEACLRIAIFVAYIWAIGLMPDMRRVFGYHGAEHLCIHCFEHGLPLTPENARRFSRLHVRCGTAFLIMTMLVAIFVNTLVPVALWAEEWGLVGMARTVLVAASRIVLIPLVAGLSYEVTVKWAGAHPELPIVRAVLWPGLQMQRLTTREPDDGMLECAIAALECVRSREEAAGIDADVRRAG